jgi:hypothetical protein
MKMMKERKDREREREGGREIRGSNMFAHGQVLYTLNDLSGMSTQNE